MEKNGSNLGKIGCEELINSSSVCGGRKRERERRKKNPCMSRCDMSGVKHVKTQPILDESP
jgi:hypothetical protein